MPRSSNGPTHICYLASRISSKRWNQCCEVVKVPRSCHLYFRISSKRWKQCCEVAKVPRSYHLYFLFCSSRPCSWISFRRWRVTRKCEFLRFSSTPSLFLTSTPVAKDNAPFKSSNAATFTSVDVTIKYPSKTVNRTLAKDYETIAKALTFGPPQRLAKAVLKCKLLSKHVNLLSESGLCSRKTPSLLRKCGKEDLENFKFQSLCDEWRERPPLFFSFLMTCCISGRSRDQAVKWLPSAVVAGSVLLKQRNQEMNATASVLGVLLKTGSIEVFLYKMCFHFFLVTKNSLLSFIVIKFWLFLRILHQFYILFMLCSKFYFIWVV